VFEAVAISEVAGLSERTGTLARSWSVITIWARSRKSTIAYDPKWDLDTEVNTPSIERITHHGILKCPVFDDSCRFLCAHEESGDAAFMDGSEGSNSVHV
jgi:hypothetical protein